MFTKADGPIVAYNSLKVKHILGKLGKFIQKHTPTPKNVGV